MLCCAYAFKSIIINIFYLFYQYIISDPTCSSTSVLLSVYDAGTDNCNYQDMARILGPIAKGVIPTNWLHFTLLPCSHNTTLILQLQLLNQHTYYHVHFWLWIWTAEGLPTSNIHKEEGNFFSFYTTELYLKLKWNALFT